MMNTGDIKLNKSVMAIGAHADDVEIHAGGTLEKYFHQGYEVIYVMSTNNMSGQVSTLNPDGTRNNRKEKTQDMMPRRKRECDIAAAEWNTTPIHLDHPQRHYTDENLDKVELRYGSPCPSNISPDAPTILTACEHKPSIEKLKNLILEKNPEVIFTHGIAQENPEHFCTALLVTRAYWAAVKEGYKGALLMWREHHTLFGPYESRWETYIDYSPFLTRKMELIGKHACQMPTAMQENFGHRVLGMEFGRACGCYAAEPFLWVRRSEICNHSGPVYGSLMMELINNTK